MAEITLEEREIAQKRTIRTLMAGLVPAGAAMSGAYSAAAVLGEELSGSETLGGLAAACLLYTSPSPRDLSTSRMPSSA